MNSLGCTESSQDCPPFDSCINSSIWRNLSAIILSEDAWSKHNQIYTCTDITIKTHINEFGHTYTWHNANVTKVELEMLIQRAHDQCVLCWFEDANNSRKLKSYAVMRKSYIYEPNLNYINIMKYRIALPRFRCSKHKLMIKEGIYRAIDWWIIDLYNNVKTRSRFHKKPQSCNIEL